MSNKSIPSHINPLDAASRHATDPEVDAQFFERATVTLPPPKRQLTIRLDEDLLEWFKGHGRGYQTRINAILRAYYEAHKNERANRA